MPYDTKAGPRDYGKIHLFLSYVAAASLLLLLLEAFGIIADGYSLIGTTLGGLSIIVMYGTRNSDEWIASLWSAGANAGFIGAMAWLVFFPFVEGFYDGLTGLDSHQDFPSASAAIAALACFVIAFNLKRIRGY